MPETMSTPVDFSGSGRSSGQKPSFSRTCSLLSRYLKEKGSFGDLSLGMTCNLDDKAKFEAFRPTTTMNLLPKMEVSGEGSERKEDVSDRNVKSMDLFPQHGGFGPSEDSRNGADMRPKAVELEKAQMTIFYGGKVHVFNDFPADKAREVMQFAVTGGPQQPGNERRNLPPTNNTNTKTSFASASVPAASSNPTQPNVLGSDLPIARKVSLHRFLEKRKERISSKGPYQLHKGEESDAAAAAVPPKKESSKSWLGLTSLQPN
ncbi:hypothetical protein AAC387_Pa09g2221 [Persea americana]